MLRLFVGGSMNGRTTEFPSDVFGGEDGEIYRPDSWLGHNYRESRNHRIQLFVLEGFVLTRDAVRLAMVLAEYPGDWLLSYQNSFVPWNIGLGYDAGMSNTAGVAT